jgi:hypothetical protein
MLMSAKGRTARLHYLPNGFRQLSGGDHVVCAVTAAEIPLDHLRYWCVQRQEPYATPEAATQALLSRA